MKDYKNNFELRAKKVQMSQIYSDSNELLPVTVLKLESSFVTQLKTDQTDGYTAVQFATIKQKQERLSKSQKGHFEKAGVSPMREVNEFRVPKKHQFELGQELPIVSFQEGEFVDIIANGKGRGFQGVVKRYNFAGQPDSHGHMSHRRPGSIGHCQWPGEVQKGKKMPGHMGDKRVTVQNLKVVKVLPDLGVILVKGSVPGFKGAMVTIRKAVKKRNKK